MSTVQPPSNRERLFALMYSSQATGDVTGEVLDGILLQARAKNERLGITGILLFRQGRFYQYLEGDEASVRGVYADICRDSRHERLRVLIETPVNERRFADWTMGYEPLRAEPAAVPPGVRSTFADLEDTDRPDSVLRAVTELTLWYRARAARSA